MVSQGTLVALSPARFTAAGGKASCSPQLVVSACLIKSQWLIWWKDNLLVALVILGRAWGHLSAGWCEGDTGGAQPGDGGQTYTSCNQFWKHPKTFFRRTLMISPQSEDFELWGATVSFESPDFCKRKEMSNLKFLLLCFAHGCSSLVEVRSLRKSLRAFLWEDFHRQDIHVCV